MAEMKQAEAKTVVGNFSLNANLPNGRSISLSAYLIDGEDAESLNKRLDACQDAIERQRSRCEVPELEGKVEMLVKSLEQIRESLGGLEAKKLKGETLSSQERMTIQNHKTNIGKINDEIQRGQTAIAEAKRKAGMG